MKLAKGCGYVYVHWEQHYQPVKKYGEIMLSVAHAGALTCCINLPCHHRVQKLLLSSTGMSCIIHLSILCPSLSCLVFSAFQQSSVTVLFCICHSAVLLVYHWLLFHIQFTHTTSEYHHKTPINTTELHPQHDNSAAHLVQSAAHLAHNCIVRLQ